LAETKRFSIPAPPPLESPDAPAFSIAGIARAEDGTETERSEEFRCVPRLPGAVLADFVSNSSRIGAAAILTLIREAIVPADEQRFAEVVRDKSFIVPVEVLDEIAAWLIRTYSNRPTQLPSVSDSGQQTTPSTSTDASPSPDSQG
jgi:hypothetical protein